jgi:hypothetical protein
MAYLKTQYKRMQAGGAVTADEPVGNSAWREAPKPEFSTEPAVEDNAKRNALLAARRAQRNAPQHDMPLSTRGYSAPVSRETPSSYEDLQRGMRGGNGTITLGNAEKEAARIAGVSEEEYARQLVRLRDLKRDGFYGGS